MKGAASLGLLGAAGVETGQTRTAQSSNTQQLLQQWHNNDFLFLSLCLPCQVQLGHTDAILLSMPQEVVVHATETLHLSHFLEALQQHKEITKKIKTGLFVLWTWRVYIDIKKKPGGKQTRNASEATHYINSQLILGILPPSLFFFFESLVSPSLCQYLLKHSIYL